MRELSGLAPADLGDPRRRDSGGSGEHVSRHGTVPEQAAELIRWAESPTGPGLAAVEEAVKNTPKPLDWPIATPRDDGGGPRILDRPLSAK